MKTAIIFPGQGAQSAGMGKDMYENNELYAKTFDEMDDALDVSLKDLCFNGCEKSEFVQPAIFAHSIALLNALEVKADVYAGLSLGEYSALCAGGVLDKKQTVSLVNKRGYIMDNAVETGSCGMVSALGLDIDTCYEIADSISDLWVANYISEGQIVFGGKNSAVETAVKAIEVNGAKAIKLNTQGPYHTPLLSAAASEFKTLLDGVQLGEKNAIIYSNYTGLPYDDDADYTDLLAHQMYGTVRWANAIDHMIESGVKRFIEVGPGMVLSKVLKRKVKGSDIEVVSVRDLKTFTKFKEV